MKLNSMTVRVMALIISCLITASGLAQAQSLADLGTAADFTVLGGSAVTSTGASVINGNLGVSPGVSVTGFPPGLVINGTININNGPASTAHSDTITAYDLFAGAPITATLTGEDLGTLTLTPGVYKFSSSAQLTGTLKLDNTLDPTGAYVFQIATTLTTATSSSVLLLGASDPNVFWQVGTSATLGTGTVFYGNILADASISLAPGASLSVGRALAINGAVTMAGGNTVNLSAPGAPPLVPAGAYWNGGASDLWSGLNWSPDPTGATTGALAANADVVFSVTGVPPQNQDTQLDFNALIGSLTVNDPMAVSISGSNTLTVFGVAGATSTITINSGAGLTTINSDLLLGGAAQGITVNNLAGLRINGVVGGTIGLTKSGTGTLYLTNANTYSGGTSFNGGTVEIGSSTNGGSGAAALAFTTGPLGSGTITVDAATTLTTDGGNYTLANDFFLMPPLTVNVASGTSLTLPGQIYGADGLTVNAGGATTGTLILAGHYGTGTHDKDGNVVPPGQGNTYQGATIIQGGTLQAATGSGDNNAFSANSALTLNNNGSTTTLDVNGINETIGSLTGDAGTVVTNNGGISATLSTNGNGDTTSYQGVIQDGTGIIGLTKNGVGTLTLGGLNTNSGNTLVVAGTLAGGVQANTFSDNSAFIVAGGATLDLAGFNNHVGSLAGAGIVTNSVAGSSTLTEGDLGTSTTFSGVIQDGAGIIGLTKNGAGTLTLTGLNTNSGNTLVTAGTLAGGVQVNTFSDNSAFTVAGGATLDLAGFNNHVGSLAGAGIVTNSVVGGATLAEGDLGTSTTFSGVIQDGAGIVGLTKNGAGTLTLTGLNTNSGNTLVTAGTLTGGVQVNTFSDNSAFTIAGGATFDLAGFNNHVGSLAGAGIVTNSVAGSTMLTEGDLGTSTMFSGMVQDGAGIIGLTKNGAGTLTLNGVNTYSGTTTINAGTLLAGSTTAFSPNSDVTLNGTSQLDLGGNSNSIASLSSAVTTTTVTNNGVGPANLTINDANSSLAVPRQYTFAGLITDGTQALGVVKAGAGTLTLTHANIYSAGTTINGGTLVVGNSNALGNGFVTNNATLQTTATAIPGTPVTAPLAISVNGVYTQTAAATLLLQVATSPAPTPSINSGVAGTNYDTLAAAGAAFLGGTLDLNFAAASVPSQGQRYVAVSAGAPLTTTFVFPTTTNLSTFDPSFYTVTTYNDSFGGSQPANSAIVTILKPFTTFPGLTANQTSVAGIIDNSLTILNGNGSLAMPTGINKDFFDNIVTGLNVSTYTNGGLGAALNQLSPQRFDILRNVAFDNFALDMQNLDDELARERNGQGGIDTSGFAFNDPTLGTQLSQIKGRLLAWSPAPMHGLLSDSAPAILGGVQMSDEKDLREATQQPAMNRWNGFVDGGVDLGNLDSSSDVNRSSYTTGRVRGGIDYRVATTVRVGALFGYSHTDAKLDNEGSKAKVDSYTPGLYVAYADKAGFYANGLATYTRNDYSTDRNIIFSGVNRTANGSTGGNQFGADLDGGYEFHRKNWTFGPSAGLTYVNMGIDHFNETGAGAANLNVNGQSSDSLRSRLGGTVRYQAKIGSVAVTPHMSAFWQHEFLNSSQLITSQFQGLPSSGVFSVQTPAGDSDNALLGFGVDVDLNKSVTLFVDYQAEAGGSNFFGQSASAGVKVGF